MKTAMDAFFSGLAAVLSWNYAAQAPTCDFSLFDLVIGGAAITATFRSLVSGTSSIVGRHDA
jgi:hypothetical protein